MDFGGDGIESSESGPHSGAEPEPEPKSSEILALFEDSNDPEPEPEPVVILDLFDDDVESDPDPEPSSAGGEFVVQFGENGD